MDTKEMLTKAAAGIADSGFFEKQIQEAMEKCIKQIIHDHFGTYGKGGEQIKAAVVESLAIGKDLDLPSYNHTILEILRRQVESQTRAIVEQQVLHNVERLLQPPPESIKLSELIDQFIEKVKEKARGACVCHGDEEISFHREESDYGWTELGFDETSGKSLRDCEIKLSIRRTGEILSMCYRNQDVEKQLFVDHIYGFERSLFQMKAAGTKLVLDLQEHEVEKAYSLHED